MHCTFGCPCDGSAEFGAGSRERRWGTIRSHQLLGPEAPLTVADRHDVAMRPGSRASAESYVKRYSPRGCCRNRAQDFAGVNLVIRPFVVRCTISSRNAIKSGNDHDLIAALS